MNETKTANGQSDHKRVIGEPTAETIILRKFLLKLEVNQAVTYATLNALVPGDDVQGAQRGWLSTAIRHCEADGIFIRCVPKVGVKRVSDNAEASLWSNVSERCRRASRKARRRLAHVEFDRLTQKEKVQYHLGLSVLGATEMFLKPANTAQLEAKIEKDSKQLSFAETIAAFKQ